MVQFMIRPFGRQFRVIDTETDIILRTLDTRREAEDWCAAVQHNPNKR